MITRISMATDPDPLTAPSAAVGDSSAPERIGGYRLGAAIASGGFGVVFRAVHEARGTPVALKILHADLAPNAEAVARFEREVAALQRVRHPNVIQVFDFGRLDDGRPYFTMELLLGVSLKEHLD